LRIADDESCTLPWLTREEAAGAAEREALSRVAKLEAELARLKG
jgi:hypothetical protein